MLFSGALQINASLLNSYPIYVNFYFVYHNLQS